MAKYVKRRTYKKKKYYKKPSLAKQIIRMADSKSFCEAVFQNAIDHDGCVSISPTQRITQGVTNTNRIGDTIYLQNLVVNGYYTCPTAALSITRVRIMVIWSRLAVANTTFVSGVVGPTQLFLSGSTATTNVNGIVNSKAVTVLSDMILEVNPSISTAKDVKSFAFTVPLNQNFDYAEAVGTMGKRKNLYIVAIPMKVGGGDDAGDVVLSYALKFKDP